MFILLSQPCTLYSAIRRFLQIRILFFSSKFDFIWKDYNKSLASVHQSFVIQIDFSLQRSKTNQNLWPNFGTNIFFPSKRWKSKTDVVPCLAE